MFFEAQISRLVGVQKGLGAAESCVYPTVSGTAPSPTQRRFSRGSPPKLKLEMQRAGEDGGGSGKLGRCLVVEELGSSGCLADPKDEHSTRGTTQGLGCSGGRQGPKDTFRNFKYL